jgi:hypothetical protein
MESQPDRITQEIEILGLRREAAELAGEQIIAGGSLDVPFDGPLEVEELFWRQVLDYERAPDTTYKEELARDNVLLVSPDELDDEQLPPALWALIRALAARSVYLYSTDHLSDRELYRWLWGEGLCEKTKVMPPDSGWACHLDVLGSGCEEDTYLHMRYFADEESRASWLADFPDYEMPEHEDPPYDRDRFLPQRQYGPPVEDYDLLDDEGLPGAGD